MRAYFDTGENGVLSFNDFKAVTALNRMEFVTAEEIVGGRTLLVS